MRFEPTDRRLSVLIERGKSHHQRHLREASRGWNGAWLWITYKTQTFDLPAALCSGMDRYHHIDICTPYRKDRAHELPESLRPVPHLG